MTILGISAFYHDSAAAIIHNGNIEAAAQEERFTRIKNDSSFPGHAIRFCLQHTGLSLDQLDAVAYYEKPFLKFERLLETYYNNAPMGWLSFLSSMPVWLDKKLFLKKIIYSELNTIEKYHKHKLNLLFPEHHLSHAASAFYPSGFDSAAVLTIDGVGEWATASICYGEGNKMTVLQQLDFPHSLGLLYAAFTDYCGFDINSGEYKLMGLAPYGNRGSTRMQAIYKAITTTLATVKDDGSIHLDQRYFQYATGLRMTNEKKWEVLFGFPRRRRGAAITQHYCDMAMAIQQVTEDVILKMAQHARSLTGSDYLCMAGGVALNCVANGRLDNTGLFREIFIQPAAGDAGGALGAALAAHHIFYDNPKNMNMVSDSLNGAYLGPAYNDPEVQTLIRTQNAVCTCLDEDTLLEKVASLVAEGHIVGWHQGRMEFGPRALGSRSILADARDSGMQKKLNQKIKYREDFRPFAPVVLAEDVQDYFEHAGKSPYMSVVKKVKQENRYPYPQGFEDLDVEAKAGIPLSDIPSVTHVDYTSRIQTVHRETNPRLWKLLHRFKAITGISVMINTSFNIKDEPIVNTPEDAYRCFMRTEMDFLVIGHFLFDKQLQPATDKP